MSPHLSMNSPADPQYDPDEFDSPGTRPTRRSKRRHRLGGKWFLFLPLILAFLVALWLAYRLASPHHRNQDESTAEIHISWSDSERGRRLSAAPELGEDRAAWQALSDWYAHTYRPSVEPLIGAFSIYEATNKGLDLETREACLRLRQSLGETGREVVRNCPEALLELHLAEFLTHVGRLVNACVEEKPYAALEAQEMSSVKLEELDRAMRSFGLTPEIQ